MKKDRFTNVGKFLSFGLSMALLVSCSHKIATPDEKFLSEFHQQYDSDKPDVLYRDSLALYVDYSTCMAMGQSSPFFNALVPSFVDAAAKYYSIRGAGITEETGSTFELLRTIQEVNYADLKAAIERMAEGKGESALLTDGEYYQQNIAKGNINNPYMAQAFKKWLLRGHDIYIISEPYVETVNGRQYGKKRFYFLFTDVRLAGNIYSRIMQTAQLQNFPDVEIFHLAADHPSLLGQSSHSCINPLLESKVQGFGNYEIQEWSIDWKNGIEPLVVSAVDQKTGNPLPNGDYILKGIKVDRNSLGGFRIEDVAANVYNINEAYAAYYDAKQNGIKSSDEVAQSEVINFIKLDDKEFSRHGEIALYFDTGMYDPSWMDGSPYNYMKIDLRINKVSPMFDQYVDMFKFDSIDMPGETNVSVAASIQQCMADPDVQNMVMSHPFYSIYVKSFER